MEGPQECLCRDADAPSLAVLQDVQRAYHQRMDTLDRVSGCKKQKMQIELLRAWVGDLAEQNSLLVHAVEELEAEATSRLILKQRKHSEMVCELRAEVAVLRRRLARKDSDLRGLVEVLRRIREFDYCTLDGIHFFEVTESDIFGSVDWQHKKMAQGDLRQNMKHNTEHTKNFRHRRCEKRCMCGKVNELKLSNDTLHKENASKDREIRKLHKDVHQYEQTIMNLRNEISLSKYQSPDVSKKDAEVMAGMSCTGAECGDWEPVKDFDSILRGEMASYQERMRKMEATLKSSGDDVRALRKVNVGLREELHSVRGVCAALSEQCRAAALRGQFKDEIIREMRRQLKHAKAKSREAAELISTKSRSPSRDPEVAFETVNIACVRQQPRRSRDFMSPAPSRSLSADGECSCNVAKCAKTSTPNASRQRNLLCPGQSPDVSIIETVHPMSASSGCRDKRQVPTNSGNIERLFYNQRVGSSSSCVGRQRTGKCTNPLRNRTKSKSATKLAKPYSKIKLEAKSASFCINAKDSVCGSSGTVSPNSSCSSSARAQYYENRLLATLQILENKEEIIRDKVESLSIAEAKIATLTARDVELKKEIDRKEREIQTLRKILEEISRDKFEDKVDVCVTAKVEGDCTYGLEEENKRLKRIIEEMRESACGSSAAVSPGSSCPSSTRAQHCENKLLATLQILENKEETIRVQAKSLSVAEGRIATLVARDVELKREIDRKGQEIQNLRKILEDMSKDKFQDKVDVCIAAEMQEMGNRENIVITLQNNLSVIEDLYRESFYESVKQESLVEMLRKTYLDVRLVEKEKCDHISRLHYVINTQKWSLDRCQDIATEVDNLKMEISNFLNNSNNDSGVWEESAAGELNEDLQEIAAQLLRLRELLTGDCTCGLEEENKRLKRNNDELGKEICGLRTEIIDLEARLKEMSIFEKLYREQMKLKEREDDCTCKLREENERLKSINDERGIEICGLRTRNMELENRLQELNECEKRCQEQIENKERELRCIRDRILSMENDSMQQISCCETLTRQLSQAQDKLTEKSTKLVELQNQCEGHQETIRGMREILDDTEQISNENLSLRSEVCAAARRAARLQRSQAALQDELAQAQARRDHVEACYREKATSTAELEAQLDEAHARGARLCGEARRVVGAVRGWARRMREMHREQEEQIKQKEAELRSLQRQLDQSQTDSSSKPCQRQPCWTPPPSTSHASLIGERQRCTAATRAREIVPTCSKHLSRSDGSYSSACACERERPDDGARVRDTRGDGAVAPCAYVRERRGDGAGTSASEAASCSSTPVPPKRALRKKHSPCVIRTPLLRRFPLFGPYSCDASVQGPRRRDAAASCDIEARHSPHRCMRCLSARAPCDPCSVAAAHAPCSVPAARAPCSLQAERAPCSVPAARAPCPASTARAPCSVQAERAPCSVPARRAPRSASPARASCSPCPAQEVMPMSPAEEMFSRIECLSEALADGYRRWTRRATE